MFAGHEFLLGLHFLGLFLAGAAAFGLPIIGATTAKAPAEHRPSVGAAVKPLKMAGHIGIGILILTGVILAVMGDVFANGPTLFWLKLILVAALVGGIVNAGRTGARAIAGDADAAGRMPTLSLIKISLGVLIVFSAVFAFH